MNEALNKIAAFAREKHKGQERSTIDLLTGDPENYADTHLNMVVRHVGEILDRVWLPEEEQKLMRSQPIVAKVIARLHDLFEDVKADECEKKCARADTCEYICENLRNETFRILSEAGFGHKTQNLVVDKVTVLTKNRSMKKPDRDILLYENLRKEPFWVKLIKLADQLHNLSSLAGKSFKSALKNYLKIRNSWGIIFTDTELDQLCRAGFLESRQSMERRTQIFQDLYDQIYEGKKIGPDEMQMFAEEMHFYNSQDGVFGHHVNLDSTDFFPGARLGSLVFYSEYSPEPRAMTMGEKQLGIAFHNEKDVYPLLELAHSMGLESCKGLVIKAIEFVDQVHTGVMGTNSSSDAVPIAQTILRELDMSGTEFVTTTMTDAEFRAKMKERMEQQRPFDFLEIDLGENQD